MLGNDFGKHVRDASSANPGSLRASSVTSCSGGRCTSRTPSSCGPTRSSRTCSTRARDSDAPTHRRCSQALGEFFIGRFIALLRTWAAVLAGAAHMPYGTFMLYNALGWRWFVRNRDRLVERTQLVWQRVLTTPGLQELKVRYPRAWTFVAARFARGEYLGLHLTVGFVISLAGLWLFGGVTEDVIHHDPLTQFDMALLDWLHRHATPTGYAIFHAITLLGSPVTLTVLALGVGLLLATRRQWILLGGWLTAFAGGGVLDG